MQSSTQTGNYFKERDRNKKYNGIKTSEIETPAKNFKKRQSTISSIYGK